MRLIAFLLAICVAAVSLADTVNVAAAISMKGALSKVAEQYKAETGVDVAFTFGASGQLMAQIQNGATVDLFISAAAKQADDLVKAGVADAKSQKIIATNSLVLVTPKAGKAAPKSLQDLADSAITKIAIGEPKSVPAGQYAEQAMKSANVYDAVKNKLVYGMNVRQVLDYVERGDVSAGLVYATDAHLSGDKVQIAFTVDASTHDPIVYPAVIITATKQRAAAEKFLDYLTSEKGQKVLAGFGFAPPGK